MRNHPCPICKKQVTTDSKAFPFCNERCRLIDLGNWLDGKYKLIGDDATVSDRDDKPDADD